ncbi:MAG: hypothetical protein JHC33_12485 [Ignisphaera sp.]|jgi:hypothetical protein|nr:hypothetical protein [Ignisphaera sp.]
MAISISLVNTGSERVNMSVAITGNTKDGNQIMVSRKGIETLRQVVDMGEKFAAPAEKVEETLVSRLKGFPNGEDVLAYLSTNKTTVTEYVNNAVSTLATAKIKEPVGRAKKGDGFKTKQTKFALATAAKLACRFAVASEDGEITTEMLTAGFNVALETFKDLDTDTVVAAAMKIAEGRGVDADGHIRLRGEAAEETAE